MPDIDDEQYNKAVELGEAIGSTSDLEDTYRGLYEAHNKLKKFELALMWHEKYLEVLNMIHSESSQKQIGHFEAKYEYDKK